MPQSRSRFKGARKAKDKNRDSRSVTPTLRATALVQGTSQIQINDGNINVVGRDSHAHVHYHGTTVSLESVLRAIPNLRKIHQDMLAKATPGTGLWLLKGRKFRVWLEPNGDIKIMWGSGIPGAGRQSLRPSPPVVLCLNAHQLNRALVIDMLEALSREPGSSICVAYVYIRYNDRDRVTVKGILEIFVKQTYERVVGSRGLIEATYARHIQEHTEPTEKELLDLLRELSGKMLATFYVLDALDEAPIGIRLDLLKKLASLDVRLFITSRPLQVLESKFPDAHTFSIVAQDQDLDLHIAQKIESSETLQDLLQECDPALKGRIVETVKSKCRGMFLHASLQLDALQRCLTLHDVMQTLHAFPAKIEEVYQQTWDRIVNSEPTHASLAQAAFLWVLNVKQSMTIDQLRHALATSPETLNFEPTRLVSEAVVMAMCRGLITTDEESRLVRLVHYIAKRPLEELLAATFPHPHSHLASVCLAHLTNCKFQNTNFTSQLELRLALSADPLLEYAYNAWSFHATRSSDAEPVASQITSFVENCHAFPVDDNILSGFNLLGGLHLVVYYDLPMIATLPNNTSNLNFPQIKYRHTPLTLACALGKVSAAQALLNLPNILVNALNSHGDSALMVAASWGQASIVELLLADSRTDVNVVGTLGYSALICAASHGRAGTLKLLLERPDLDVSLEGAQGRSALLSVPSSRRTAILELFLTRSKIEDNLAVSKGLSALMSAASRRCNGIVGLLLARPEIEINTADREGCSALMMAASYGYANIAKLLIARPGVAVNLVDNAGFSALLLAASYGRFNIVKLLLAHPDIQVNLSHPNGTTPLLAASYYGYTAIVKLLLGFPGINVNAIDAGGDTAIKMAAEQGHAQIVQMLLDVPGIDTTVASKNGRTAMSAALAHGDILIVFLLRRFEFIHNLQAPWLLKSLATAEANKCEPMAEEGQMTEDERDSDGEEYGRFQQC